MKYLAGSLAALLAATAWAHDPLPSANWCAHGQTTTVATFAFGAADVDAYVACVEAGDCPDPRPPAPPAGTPTPTCSSLKSCGNFDDDYGKTAFMINAHCDQYADQGGVAGRGTTVDLGKEIGTVVPIAYGPKYFTSTANHHWGYNKFQGVHGVCAKCEPLPPASGSQDR